MSIRVYCGDIEVKNLETVSWSGSYNIPYREVSIVKVNNFIAGGIIKPSLGDEIIVKYKEDIIFKGNVYNIDENSSGDLVRREYTVYDNGYRLTKNSFAMNIYNKTPNELVKLLCGKLGLEVGSLPLEGDEVKVSFPAFDRTASEIIQTAFKQVYIREAKQNKNPRMYSILVTSDGKINVVKQGVGISFQSGLNKAEEELKKYDENEISSDKILAQMNVLDYKLSSSVDKNFFPERNIREVSFKQDLTKMINQVRIYEVTEGKEVQERGFAKDIHNIGKYGVFQSVVEYDDNMDVYYEANKKLTDVEKAIDITSNGNTSLTSGLTVDFSNGVGDVNNIEDYSPDKVNEYIAGLSYISIELPIMTIISDTHTWTAEDYTTTVSLSTNIEMDGDDVKKETNKAIESQRRLSGRINFEGV